MRASIRPSRWVIPALLPMLGACALDWSEVEDLELVVASVTVVLTVDPVDSTVLRTDALAFLARDSVDGRVPGASVRIVGGSGRTLRLDELPDTAEACRNAWAKTNSQSCYAASVPSAWFAPLEELSLRIATPDGKQLRGKSVIPALFTPSRLKAQGGRCRVDPETSYLVQWRSIRGAWAHIAEAEFTGLARNLWDSSKPLHLAVAWMASFDDTHMEFPRKLIEGGVSSQALKAARRLETGLPWGVSADLAVAAIDPNWANWIRPGQVHIAGEVPVPSVFGDGTGLFGTAVRWTVTMESRDAAEEPGLVDCDLERESSGLNRHVGDEIAIRRHVTNQIDGR